MRTNWVVIAAGLLLVSACASEPLTMTSGGGAQTKPSEQPSQVTVPDTTDESPTPATGTLGASPNPETATASAAAGSCLTGTWSVRMPDFVAALPITGGAEYLTGTYTFTFAEDNTYSAEYSDVVFRIGTKKEFVDVHNSWSESGSWIGDATPEQWDGALVGLELDTSTLKLSKLELTDGLLYAFQTEDPRSMVLIAGSTFNMIEAFGMVQGSFRTPPLSDDGAALIALGTVDCDTGVLRVDTLLPEGASTITMDRTNG